MEMPVIDWPRLLIFRDLQPPGEADIVAEPWSQSLVGVGEFGSQGFVRVQPIIDAGRRTITAYEALMRGINQESAASLLRHVTPDKLVAFDREARRTALEHVTRLKLPVALHLNIAQGGLSDTSRSVAELHEFARESGLRPNLRRGCPMGRSYFRSTSSCVFPGAARSAKLDRNI